MKKFILIIMMMSSMTAFAQYENVFDTVFNTVAHDLGFDTMDIRIRVMDGNMHDGLKPTDEPSACVSRTGKHSYVVYIYFALERDRMIRATIHEFIHIRQMETGLMFVKRNSIVYCGTEYTKSTPYDERPFEIEAMQMAETLFTKYFK